MRGTMLAAVLVSTATVAEARDVMLRWDQPGGNPASFRVTATSPGLQSRTETAARSGAGLHQWRSADYDAWRSFTFFVQAVGTDGVASPPSNTLVVEAAAPAGGYLATATMQLGPAGVRSSTPAGAITPAALGGAVRSTGAACMVDASAAAACPLVAGARVQIVTPARYFLWARAFFPGAVGSNDANSWWLCIGATCRKLGNNLERFGAWHWAGSGDSESGAIAPVDLGILAAGEYDVAVRVRETLPVAPSIDVYYLSNNPTISPTDADATATLYPAPTTTTTTRPPVTTTTTTTTLAPACRAADVNGDGRVTATDLLAHQAAGAAFLNPSCGWLSLP